ncbi:MAG: LysR substrate-binding domain-containing protein [Thermaerobacter sp.]|nr:LysR substrate-binding domain-containing protein [Thermaerobacter sp.]
MNLDACEAFVTIARERNFGKAARLLHVSPSAISVRLKALEDECGLRLLNREPEVSLTPAGEALLPHCESIVSRVREVSTLADQIAGRIEGGVAIGASQTVGSYVLPALLEAFQEAYPQIGVRLEIANSHSVLAGVDRSHLDFGLVETPEVGRLVRQRWMEDHLQLVMQPSHPLACAEIVRFEDLQGTTLVVRERGSGTRAVLEAEIGEQGLRQFCTVEVGSTEAIKRWIEGGRAVAFLSSRAVEREVAMGMLAARPVAGLRLRRWFLLVHRSEAFASTAAQVAYQFLQQAAREAGVAL